MRRVYTKQLKSKASSGRQHRLQKAADVFDFLRVQAVRHGVGVPLHGVAERGQGIARIFAASDWDDGVLRAVGHEDRCGGIGGVALGREALGQRQVARQGHDAGQLVREAQAGVQCHRATLAKTGQHDVFVSNAFGGLVFNQGHDLALGFLNASGVLLTHKIRAKNVVPSWHHVTAIDRDRHAGRVREDKANRSAACQINLGHEAGKIVAIGPQAVQPDHGGGGIGRGFEGDGGEKFGYGLSHPADYRVVGRLPACQALKRAPAPLSLRADQLTLWGIFPPIRVGKWRGLIFRNLLACRLEDKLVPDDLPLLVNPLRMHGICVGIPSVPQRFSNDGDGVVIVYNTDACDEMRSASTKDI